MKRPLLLPLAGLALGVVGLLIHSSREPGEVSGEPESVAGHRSESEAAFDSAEPRPAGAGAAPRSSITNFPTTPRALSRNSAAEAPAERRAVQSSDAVQRIRQPKTKTRAAQDAPPARAASSPAVSSLATTGTRAELVFELSPGMQAPAANAKTDPALRLTLEQEAIKDQIADHFVAEIDQAVATPGATPETIGPVWNSAQQRADNRVREMLGDRIFLRQSAAAAKEALMTQGVGAPSPRGDTRGEGAPTP